MNHRKRLGIMVLTTALAGSAAAADTAIDLAPIRAGSEQDYPPFCIVREDGRADGFSVELLRAALRAMGRDVTFRTGPWAEVKSWLEHGEVEGFAYDQREPRRSAPFPGKGSAS